MFSPTPPRADGVSSRCILFQYPFNELVPNVFSEVEITVVYLMTLHL